MPVLPGRVWKLRSPPGRGKTLWCLHPLTLESATGLLTKRSVTFIIQRLHCCGSPLDHFNIYRGHVRPGGAGERASELMLLLNAASDFAVYFSNASIRVVIHKLFFCRANLLKTNVEPAHLATLSTSFAVRPHGNLFYTLWIKVS